MELTISGVYKSFGEKEVLRNVNINTSGGKAFGLLGRNGAGKTTTIRILMGVFPADKGEVLFDGKPIDYSKTGIGYLPEERGLYPKKIIIDQLTYFAQLKGMTKKAAIKAIDYWLNRLGMAEYRSKRLDTLSKGNQQKIQLITALAHDPHIVILDEPFSGLDPVNALLLKDVVKEEIGNGKIVLFSSHQMNYIEEFCDEIAILDKGGVAVSGNLDEIKRAYPRNKFIIRSDEKDKIMRDYAHSCTETEHGHILFTLDSPDDKKTMMKTLAEKYDIDEIKVFEPSLNDIFVEYTDNKDAEEGNK